MNFFDNKPKDKIKNIVLSIALGISILTNLYLFTDEKQNIQQNSVQATQVSTTSDTQTKQLNDLKNENNKLTNQIKEVESQKNEVQTKLDSITEENKNLTTKISQLENEKPQQANNGSSQESSNITKSSQQVHNDTDKSNVVYKIKTGSKYHRAGCGYLSKSCYETTRSSAEAEGLSPCSRCNP